MDSPVILMNEKLFLRFKFRHAMMKKFLSMSFLILHTILLNVSRESLIDS